MKTAYELTHKLDADAAAIFLFSGNAVFSIKNPRTSKHMTFRVVRSRYAKMYFTYVLGGQEWQYVGCVFTDMPMEVRKGRKGMAYNTTSFQAASWVFRRLGNLKKDLTGAEFWHAGKCGRCGRQLTDPTSIELGIGPECRKRK